MTRQEEHIEWLIKQSEAQKLYREYIAAEGSDIPEKLITSLEELSTQRVKKYLYSVNCYSEGNFRDALQQGNEYVIKQLKSDHSDREIREKFCSYYSAIYFRQAKAYVENYCFHGHKKSAELEADQEGNVLALPADITEASDGISSEDICLLKHKRRLALFVYKLYCSQMLDNTGIPQRSIAMCFTRVLPHLLGQISEKKNGSSEWAMKEMTQKTMLILKHESEMVIRSRLSRRLRWGSSFNKQLEDSITISLGCIILKNLIYTKEYDRIKTEHWSDSLHQQLLKSTKRILDDRPDFSEEVKLFLELEE